MWLTKWKRKAKIKSANARTAAACRALGVILILSVLCSKLK
jgi:hypothetical protein